MNYFVNMNGIDVNAYYSDNTVKELFFPLLERVTKLQKEKGRRVIVYVAAPPGAGKSTLCSFLQKLSEENPDFTNAQAIGMDGFHRRQEYLDTHKTLRCGREIFMAEIKGAPETFDLTAFEEKIKELTISEKVGWPVYDRLLHNPVEDAVVVDGSIVFLEGNYLLLDQEGWRDLKKYSDLTIFIKADPDMLRERLIARKAASGNTLDKATEFVDSSDMANVNLCLNDSDISDLTFVLDDEGEYYLDKSNIRKLILEKRNKLGPDEIREKSEIIKNKLLALPEYEKAHSILIYASMGSEVITDEIILDAWSKGKNVFCPKVTDKANRQMSFVQIESLEDLKKGYFGIREPEINEGSKIYTDSMSDALVVMPGVAFDKDRNRIGYNGGFYDTFLADNKDLDTVALAFDVQIYDGRIYKEKHDIKPDRIITS
ncbi:nucleoside/nucleotide kinase family protein [Butyrivibrio sp. VCB2006]|uniref:nucleoside/nucleotide kinase family protein n=1 Tax=Butyrivibrio sp. VCB2006 TaxID=1280679 RepID=UPI0003F94539|nr:nucleoside/nucleotide kinase family protein [Butyrivibrio sp. VCB2006]